MVSNMHFLRSNKSFLYVETCIGRFTGTGGTVASKTWLSTSIPLCGPRQRSSLQSISPVIYRKLSVVAPSAWTRCPWRRVVV